MNQPESKAAEYIHLSYKAPPNVQGISTYQAELSRPLIINSDNCKVSINDFYLSTGDGDVADLNQPVCMYLAGAGAMVIKDTRMIGTASFACLIPKPLRSVHSCIDILPLTKGIYSTLSFSFKTVDGQNLIFNHLIISLVVKQ